MYPRPPRPPTTTTTTKSTAASTASSTTAAHTVPTILGKVDAQRSSEQFRSGHGDRLVGRVGFGEFHVSKTLEFARLPVGRKAHTGNLAALGKGLAQPVFVNVPRQVAHKDGGAARFLGRGGSGRRSGSGGAWCGDLNAQPAPVQFLSALGDGGRGRRRVGKLDKGRARGAAVVLEGQFAGENGRSAVGKPVADLVLVGAPGQAADVDLGLGSSTALSLSLGSKAARLAGVGSLSLILRLLLEVVLVSLSLFLVSSILSSSSSESDELSLLEEEDEDVEESSSSSSFSFLLSWSFWTATTASLFLLLASSFSSFSSSESSLLSLSEEEEEEEEESSSLSLSSFLTSAAGAFTCLASAAAAGSLSLSLALRRRRRGGFPATTATRWSFPFLCLARLVVAAAAASRP